MFFGNEKATRNLYIISGELRNKLSCLFFFFYLFSSFSFSLLLLLLLHLPLPLLSPPSLSLSCMFPASKLELSLSLLRDSILGRNGQVIVDWFSFT